MLNDGEHSSCVEIEKWHPAGGRTDSELRRAIITITSRDLREAITIREMARQTVVPVPHWLDSRGFRMASTWWMQPRGQEEARHA